MDERLVRHLAQFRALSPAGQRTLLYAAALMPLFWLGLRLLGLPRFQARLQRSTVTRDAAMSLPDIQALGELVNIAARHTLGPRTCLTRSLLLGWLLRRRGVESQLRIGVRLNQGVPKPLRIGVRLNQACSTPMPGSSAAACR